MQVFAPLPPWLSTFLPDTLCSVQPFAHLSPPSPPDPQQVFAHLPPWPSPTCLPITPSSVRPFAHLSTHVFCYVTSRPALSFSPSILRPSPVCLPITPFSLQVFVYLPPMLSPLPTPTTIFLLFCSQHSLHPLAFPLCHPLSF